MSKYRNNGPTLVWERWKFNSLIELKPASQYKHIDESNELIEDTVDLTCLINYNKSRN